MILFNKTRKTILAKDLKVANSLPDKLLGLLDKNNPRAIFFKTRLGIHTFFLKDTIEVLVLSQSFEVVKISKVKPNNILLYNPKNPYIVELPLGTCIKTGTKVGDRLEIKANL